VKAIIKKIIEYFGARSLPVKAEFPKWEKSLSNLQKKINYSFHDLTLLKASLTHKSYLRKKFNDHKIPSPFERMEFLGDSILGFVVSKELFVRYPEEQEGNLSKFKSKIVSETYLTIKANALELGRYILLSSEELQAGGQTKPSILSDTMEALICAVYLDGGISAASRFVKNYVLVGFEVLVNRIELVNYKVRSIRKLSLWRSWSEARKWEKEEAQPRKPLTRKLPEQLAKNSAFNQDADFPRFHSPKGMSLSMRLL
jgi:dsRNA-specific ribonuclease